LIPREGLEFDSEEQLVTFITAYSQHVNVPFVRIRSKTLTSRSLQRRLYLPAIMVATPMVRLMPMSMPLVMLYPGRNHG